MVIYLARHGQTNLNRGGRMQGRVDEPLNETGRKQAGRMRALLEAGGEDLRFDAVYASPLRRAVETASILCGLPEDRLIRDPRLVETDFGKYDTRRVYLLGPAMTLYWRIPEVFPAPPTVETVASMVERSRSFLKELEAQPYERVLVACHGGILRSLCGYLEDRENGIVWRPKPKNCEVRIYETKDGQHARLRSYSLP